VMRDFWEVKGFNHKGHEGSRRKPVSRIILAASANSSVYLQFMRLEFRA
jgi:hypothetical protein